MELIRFAHGVNSLSLVELPGVFLPLTPSLPQAGITPIHLLPARKAHNSHSFAPYIFYCRLDLGVVTLARLGGVGGHLEVRHYTLSLVYLAVDVLVLACR